MAPSHILDVSPPPFVSSRDPSCRTTTPELSHPDLAMFLVFFFGQTTCFCRGTSRLLARHSTRSSQARPTPDHEPLSSTCRLTAIPVQCIRCHGRRSDLNSALPRPTWAAACHAMPCHARRGGPRPASPGTGTGTGELDASKGMLPLAVSRLPVLLPGLLKLSSARP